MIIVQNYIDSNANTKIRIAQKYSRDRTDPLTQTLWEGMLEDVPEDLRKLEVIDEGWLIDAQINQLEVFIAEQNTF